MSSYDTATEAELRAEAAQWAYGEVSNEPYDLDPNMLRWHYDPAFPLDDVCWPEEQAAFLRMEQREWAEEGQPHRYDYLFEEWDTRAPEYPVIIVKGTTGEWYTWDGQHRLGVAAILGKQTIPAIVGE